MTTEKYDQLRDPWLKVFCPGGACLTEADSLATPLKRARRVEQQSAWLAVFCPGNRCEAKGPTDVL